MSKRFYLLLAIAAVVLLSAYNITAPGVVSDQANGAGQDHDEQVYEREKCVENCA